ncbi:MAG: hypothetical protein LBB23_04985 [Rickettsiales bacterium]|jgi:hypothetical protein|nr:hypothetical protein [Rickettsiales bacterium]
MKKQAMGAITAIAALTGAATAAPITNIENPLYIPTTSEVYSRTALGLVYKKADATVAMTTKGAAGQTEFPIWNAYQDLGFGITDRLAVRGAVRYTQNDDINRKGVSGGNVGLNYRIFDGATTNGIVWDMYGAAFLGGLSTMTGEFIMKLDGKKYFNYDNYTNGRWGAYLGTLVGKEFGKLSVAAWGEVLQTIGSDNNEISLKTSKATMEGALTVLGGSAAISACLANPSGAGCSTILAGFLGNPTAQTAYAITQMPNNISVNLKSTLEYNAGLRALYEIDSAWSVGGHFTYKFHADNGVNSMSTKITNSAAQSFSNQLVAGMKNMEDGFSEYIVGVLAANQITEAVQIAAYADWTFDTANKNSQNGSDAKAELGVRLNARF